MTDVITHTRIVPQEIMSAASPLPRLTTGELEIVSTLWNADPATISEVHVALGRPVGYTTVQTRLNRLVEKGVVSKSDDRPARYSALFNPEDVSRRDLDVLVRRVNGGKVVPLVAYLVRDRQLTPQEIADLRQLVDEAERQSRRSTPRGRLAGGKS
jgi:BlaI family penicillinase repressor